MKKYFVITFILLLFSSCGIGMIDYQLINNTSYDVVLIDNSDYYKTEYEVSGNSTKVIRHNNSAHFSLKDCNYPIKITNNFTTSIIDYLKTYELQINNTTNKDYNLTITDDFQGNYTISANQTTALNIYRPSIKASDIQLYFGNTEVNSFILQNNTLYIFN